MIVSPSSIAASIVNSHPHRLLGCIYPSIENLTGTFGACTDAGSITYNSKHEVPVKFSKLDSYFFCSIVSNSELMHVVLLA